MNQIKIKDHLPLVGHIELTNKCNLNCIICANRHMSRQRDIMKWSTYTRIVEKLKNAGVRQIIFNTIGETLLYPKLSEAIAFAKALEFYTVVSTNGQLLTELTAQAIFENGCDVLRISIQGTNKNEYENVHQGGDFNTLIENVQRLQGLRKKCKSQTVIRVRSVLPSQMSQCQIVKFISCWQPYVDQVEFMPFGNMGGQNGHVAIFDNRRAKCATMWRGVNILLDGRVSYCPCDFNGEFAVGSLMESELEEVWNNAKFAEIRRMHHARNFSELPSCDKCSATRQAWYERKMPVTTEVEDAIIDSYLDKSLKLNRINTTSLT